MIRLGEGRITIPISLGSWTRISFVARLGKSGIGLNYCINESGCWTDHTRIMPIRPRTFRALWAELKVLLGGFPEVRERRAEILFAIVPAQHHATLTKALNLLAQESLLETAGGA